MKVSQKVEEAIKPVFENLDVRLVMVEYLKKHDGMHLVITIDKEEGVTIEDCKTVSKKIDPIIDELNPTGDESYYLDVTSYGLDKPLKFDWQFERYIGKLVDVTLYSKFEGLKDFTASLIAFDDMNYTFLHEQKQIVIKKDMVAQVLPHIEF